MTEGRRKIGRGGEHAARTFGQPTAERALAISTVVNMTGSGAYGVALTLFLVQASGFTVSTAATVILLSSLGGKIASLAFGSVVDRYGGKATYIGTKLVCSVAMTAVLLSPSPAVTTASLLGYSLAAGIGGAGRNVLIRDTIRDQVKIFRARLRRLASVGYVIGGLLAAAALGFDADVGARACLLLNGLSCLACVAAIAPLTSRRRDPESTGHQASPRTSVRELLTSRGQVPFLTACMVFSLITPVLTFAVPIWVVDHVYPMDAWPVGLLIVTNDIVVILLQVPIGRIADRGARPMVLLVVAGAVLALALVVLGATSLVEGPLTLALVWAGVVVLSVAEVVFAAATTEVLYSETLAPHLSRTTPLFTLACTAGEAAGPLLLASVALTASGVGWLVVASGVAACAVVLATLGHRADPTLAVRAAPAGA
jgi:MFS family permease